MFSDGLKLSPTQESQPEVDNHWSGKRIAIILGQYLLLSFCLCAGD